jgi:mono/diheme cytochrome c family protein
MGKIAQRLALTGCITLAVVLSGGIALSQTDGARPRGFDYWQPDWMIRELWGPGRMPRSMMVRLLRHTTFMQFGVPAEYREAKPTVPVSPASISAGSKIYARDCASCHGSDGMGAGDTGLAVSPSPALLAYMIKRPVSVDEYLLWAIGDGGKQFESEMPAFKDKLSRDDMWRVIAYMRAGFPQQAGGETGRPQAK